MHETAKNNEKEVKIFVCTTCNSKSENNNGNLLFEEIKAQNSNDEITIIGVECLSNCNRANSVSLYKKDGWAYVFGDMNIENAKDLIDGAKLFTTSQNGILPWQGRAPALKKNMVARIPPYNFGDINE